ncbi:MAG: hypothetical protein K1060chlam5_00361 [Candidatus Anoxychlamydiales bacterium]|nr:hypothetical protein [Candidatus Anoxychlamydiales bacterium]
MATLSSNPSYAAYISKSLSAALMQPVNYLRNKPSILPKVAAQAVYPVITTVALVETAVATVFTALSTLSLPFTSKIFNNSAEWLKSSSFAIVWSVFNFLINPFCYRVAEFESTAKQIVLSGRFFEIPLNSVG